MLCPDVINFKSSLKQESNVVSGKLCDPKFKTVLKTHLQSLGNIFGVKIVLPSSGPSNTSDKIMKVLTEDTDYYVVENNFDMSVIFDKTFHHNFVLSGDLSMSTMNMIPSLIPSPTMSMSNSNLSLSLPNNDGLSHSLSQVLTKKSKTKDNTSHFQQDLKLLNLQTSQVEKLQSHLSPLPTAVAATWCHPDQSICPSSLASYLADKGMQVQGRSIMVDLHTMYNMQIPTMDKDQFCDWEPDHISDVEDWLGGVFLQLPEDTISAPPPCMSMEMVTAIQATGLFTITTILDLMTSMAMSLTSTPSLPWVSASVSGPDQVAELRGGKCLMTSDSVMTIIMTRQGDWVIRRSKTVDYTNCKPSKYA